MKNAAFIISLLILLSSCGSNDKPVPRREGFPRIEAYDTVYEAVDSLPLYFEVNSQAEHSVTLATSSAVWLNVNYPLYDAEILCSFTPVTPTTVENVIDNRTERIHLNLGGAVPTFQEYKSEGGYHTTVAVAPSAVSTPVQFISVNENSPQWVVSGMVFFKNGGDIVSIDSVAPMVEVITRDLNHALLRLKER